MANGSGRILIAAIARLCELPTFILRSAREKGRKGGVAEGFQNAPDLEKGKTLTLSASQWKGERE